MTTQKAAARETSVAGAKRGVRGGGRPSSIFPFFPIPYPFRRLRRLVSADTEGAIESVRIKRIEFRENVRAFFPQGQTKLA